MSKFFKSLKRHASKAADAVGDVAKNAAETVADSAKNATDAVGDAISEGKTSLQKKLDSDVFDAYLSASMLLISTDGEVGDEYGQMIEGLSSNSLLSRYDGDELIKGMATRLEQLVNDPDGARDQFHEDIRAIKSDQDSAEIILATLEEFVFDGSDEMAEALDDIKASLGIKA